MIKLTFLLFLSLFNIVDNTSEKYNVIFQEGNEYEVIDEVSDFSLIYNAGYILKNVNGLKYEFNGISTPKLFFDGNNLNVICNQSKKLKLFQFNKQGVLIQEKILFNENLVDNLYLTASEDYIYIGSTIMNYTSDELLKIKEQKDLDQRDAILLMFNKDFELVNFNLYGGKYNDKVNGIEYGNNNIYLVIRRIGLGGGELGNGGNTKEVTIISRINKELKLENYVTFSFVHNLIEIKYFKDYLYASFSDKLYKLDDGLNIIYKFDYKDYAYLSMFSDNNELLVLTNTTGYLYNLYDMNLKYQFNYILDEDFILREFDKRLYYYNYNKGYYFDIYNLEDFEFKKVNYENSNDKIIVRTLFGSAELIKEIPDKLFNNQVYGKYNINFLFKSLGGIEFDFTKEKVVPFQSNVLEGGIYPLGYQLLFTGVAYLNDELIINNHPVMNEGNYQLKLIGASGEERVIYFTIDSGQIQFTQNKYQEWDIESSINSSYYLKYNIDNLDNVTILGFVINGIYHDNFIVEKDKGLLSLKIIAPNKPGIYLNTINQINYIFNNEERVYKLNQDYLLNVLCESPLISINNENNPYVINFSVNDFDNSIRYFQLVVTSNTDERIFLYPINTTNIEVSNLIIGKLYDITLSIVYEKGNLKNEIEEIIKFRIKAGSNKIEIGNIIITRRSQRLESFNIDISNINKGVQEIRLLNNIIFDKQGNELNKYYILILIVPIVILVSVLIRKKVVKK